MSAAYSDVAARIETVHKLEAVIAAMRGIAAARVQEAHAHTRSIRTYATTIGDAIGHALSFVPLHDKPPNDTEETRHVVVLLTAEQGFAGAFSEAVFAAAAPAFEGAYELLLVGGRGLEISAEHGRDVSWSASMIAHPAEASGLATRITDAIYARLAKGDVSHVSIIHSEPGEAGQIEMKVSRLVPFDYGRFTIADTLVPPRLTLPPEQLLERLVEEYLFAEVSEAVMLSFAAENEARMRAMIAAHDNVVASLETLVAASRRLRQQEITEEIVELATGSMTQDA